MLKRYFSFLLLCFLFLLSSALLFAGNPIGYVSHQQVREGQPLIWKSGVIPYWTDRGSLGYLPNRSAKNLVSQAIRRWSDACSKISFQERDGIFEDIDGANFRDYLGKRDGISPVIFDNDGQILRALGFSQEVLGFSTPEFVDPATGYVTEAYSIINTDPFDFDKNDACGELDEKYLEALLVHEFGHFIGLGHSQVNGDAYFSKRAISGYGIPPENMVETMYPYLLVTHATLKYDDIVTVNWLYGNTTFFSTKASFHGSVYQSNGVREVQGVNVIARNVNTISDPLAVYRDAVSQISGVGFHPDLLFPSVTRGEFLLPGIPAMTAMRVEIEYLGPGEWPVYMKPEVNDFLPEFYNGIDEAGTSPPDDPEAATSILLPAGEKREIRFLLNPPLILTEVIPSSVPSHSDSLIVLRGNGFLPGSWAFIRNEDNVGSASAYPLLYDDPTQVHFILPYNLYAGRNTIIVGRPPGGNGNESLNSVTLTVTANPMTVSSISPAQVLYNSNEQIQVRGINFYRDLRLQLRHKQHGYEVSLVPEVLTPGLLVFYNPSEAVPGDYNLSLLRPPGGAENETAPVTWRVVANPLAIQALSPSTVTESTGINVTVLGSGFTNGTYLQLAADAGGGAWKIDPAIKNSGELSFALPSSLIAKGTYSIVAIRPPGDTLNYSNKASLNVQWVPPSTTTTLTPPTTTTLPPTTTSTTTSTTLPPTSTTTTTRLLTSTTTSTSSTTSTIFNLQPFGQLETPSNAATVSNIIPISGWAVDDHGQTKLTLLIDGVPDNAAVTRYYRPDIAAMFPQFPNSDTAGFRIDLDTTRLTDGFHQISVLIMDRFGVTATTSAVLVFVFNHP